MYELLILNVRKNFWQFFIIWLLILSVLCISYWPALHINYLFHDDFYYYGGTGWQLWDKRGCSGYSQMNSFFYVSARPLAGYIRCAYGIFLTDIPSGKFLRMFDVFLLSINCLVAYGWLRFCKLEKLPSVIIVILIGTLSAYQPPIAQLTNGYHLYAAIAALCGLILATRAIEYPAHQKKLLWLAFAVMSMATLIYPPAAMLYWSYLSCYVLFKLEKIDKPALINLIKVGIPAVFAMGMPKLWALVYGTDQRGQLTHDIFAKLYWLIHDVIPLSMSYWLTFPSQMMLLSSLGILLLAGVLYCIKQFITKKSLALSKGLICIILVLLSFAPDMLVAESIANHRIIIAIQTVLFLIVAFATLSIFKIISRGFLRTIIYTVLGICLIVWASWTTNLAIATYYADPSHTEYMYLRNEFIKNRTAIESPEQIYLVTAQPPFLAKQSWADEYGNMSSYWKDDLLCYTTALSLELNLKINTSDIIRNKKFIIVQNSADVPKNAVVININDMLHGKPINS